MYAPEQKLFDMFGHVDANYDKFIPNISRYSSSIVSLFINSIQLPNIPSIIWEIIENIRIYLVKEFGHPFFSSIRYVSLIKHIGYICIYMKAEDIM